MMAVGKLKIAMFGHGIMFGGMYLLCYFIKRSITMVGGLRGSMEACLRLVGSGYVLMR